MPCHTAISPVKITVKPNDYVEDVLGMLHGEHVTHAAVLDDDGTLAGVFSFKTLLGSLIPVSVAMAGGVQLDVNVVAAPGVAKRLNNVKRHPVSEVMDRKPHKVSPDAPIWEGVSLLIRNGGPLCVCDDNDVFHGFITYSSLITDLENMQTTDS